MTADEVDILQPIPDHKIPLLLEVLENDFPSSVFVSFHILL